MPHVVNIAVSTCELWQINMDEVPCSSCPALSLSFKQTDALCHSSPSGFLDVLPHPLPGLCCQSTLTRTDCFVTKKAL